MSLPLNSLPEHHSAQAHARYNMIEQQIRPWNVLDEEVLALLDRKSTRLNSSHSQISYAVFCLKKKKGSDTAVVRSNISAHCQNFVWVADVIIIHHTFYLVIVQPVLLDLLTNSPTLEQAGTPNA